MSARAPIFLDRDGTLIEDVVNPDPTRSHKKFYQTTLEQMRLLPGAAEAVRRANEAGHPVIVVTNQSAVARGYIDEAFARASGEHLRALLAPFGAHLDGYYYCPYHLDGHPPYNRDHPDRKPGHGMLVRAAQELNLSWNRVPGGQGLPTREGPEIALRGAWMIGDKRSDVETGAALGVIPVLVRTGYGASEEPKLAPDFAARGGRVFDDLAAAMDWILAQD